MKLIPVRDAVGHILCHDITQIIKDTVKDARFRKGHVVKPEDIPVLLSMGKEHLYVWENEPGMVHENDAAKVLYEICADGNMSPTPVKEGKIDVIADMSGLLLVDTEKLKRLNSIGEIMMATRHGYFPVKKGDKLAGTRVIPLAISGEKLVLAQEIGAGKPVLSLLPFEPKKTGIIITGSEVFSGRVEDAFTPVLREKLAEYGCKICARAVLGDDPAAITRGIVSMIENGAGMVLCTGGMSVDPDDRTPLAIKNTGARVVSYGAPVLPGAMFMLAYYNDTIPVIGLPGCVMYHERTIFDLVLPRILAGLEVAPYDLAAFGHGGLCLNCGTCVFPNCGFGKA